jgi:hypothetical protein
MIKWRCQDTKVILINHSCCTKVPHFGSNANNSVRSWSEVTDIKKPSVLRPEGFFMFTILYRNQEAGFIPANYFSGSFLPAIFVL